MSHNRLVYMLVIAIFLLFSGCTKDKKQTNHSSEILLDSTNFKSTIENTLNRDKLPFAKTGGINLGIYNLNGEIEKDFNFNIEEHQSLKNLFL